MANEIKTTIGIDVGDGEQKLKSLGDAGSAALKQIDEAAKATTKSLDELAKITEKRTSGTVSADQFKAANEAFKKQTEEFNKRAAAQAVAPAAAATPAVSGDAVAQLKTAFGALQAATSGTGASFGLLNTAMAAASGNAVELATAIGGALLVAFGKATDSVNDAVNRLGAITGSIASGQKAFEGLQELGKTLGVSATDLAKPFGKLLEIGDTQPEASKKLAALVDSFKSDRVPVDKAMDAISSLLSDIEKGPLSPERLKQLGEVSPRTEQALRAAIQREAPGAIETGIIPSDLVSKVIGSKEFADQVRKNLEDAGQAVDSIPTAWNHLKTSAEHLAEVLGGGTNIVSEVLDQFAKILQQDADDIAAFYNRLQKIKASVAPGAAVTTFGADIAGAGDVAGDAKKIADATAIKIGTPAPLGGTVSTQFEGFYDRLKESTDALAEHAKAVDADKAAQEQANKIPKELGAIGAGLAKAQAGLDLKFLPAEQASQLEHDKLNVERADIAVQSAQIGVQEAQKQLALAGVAPEQAKIALDQAKLNLDNIQLQQQMARFAAEGRDLRPGADPDVDLARQRQTANQREALDLQERQAKVALEVAKINDKYSYLEVPKAELGARNADIALKSAKLEQSDASLKLAKDEAGQPIARDLSALRYAQAQWDELKKLSEYGKGTVDSLKTIIELLSKQKEQQSKSDDQKKSGDQKSIEQQQIGQQKLQSAQPEPPQEKPQEKWLSPEEMQKLRDSFIHKTSADDAGTPANTAQTQLDNLATAARSAADTLASIKAPQAPQGSPDGGAVEVAGGGHITGPGHGTSDNIAAWLSPGEFVHNARATAHYGTDFMRAVNSLQFSKFNAGGLVGLFSPSMPRFAAGGLVHGSNGGMQHLGTVDLRTDHGSVSVMASANAATQLQRLAVQKRITSTGRKPGFIA